MWNSHLPSDRGNISIQEGLAPDNWPFLERNFTVRFRCLLDNTSGFLRLDIRGRVKVLHGQNHKSEEPPLALFAVCTPFGPPSLMETPNKDSTFKSKHKLDFSFLSMDSRGRQLLGYTETEIISRGGYDLVHFDDLAYVASAHQERKSSDHTLFTALPFFPCPSLSLSLPLLSSSLCQPNHWSEGASPARGKEKFTFDRGLAR